MSTQQIRVLQVAASVARSDGGPATAILEMNRHLLRRGVDSLILTTDAEGRGRLAREELTAARRAADLNIQIYRMHAPRALKASLTLGLALQRLVPNVDVVHIHGMYLFHSALAAGIARRNGIPYLLQPHGNLEPYQQGKSVTRKRIYDQLVGDRALSGARAIVFADESERTNAFSRRPLQPSFVVRLGARLDALSPGHRPAFADVLSEGPVVLFLGRLAPKKRVDLLLAAWPQVLAQWPTAQLVLAGPEEPSVAGDLHRRAAELPKESVLFLGPVLGQDKTYLYGRASAFALPSENENFAISVAEALQAHLPVLVSDGVATHADVQQYDAGVVIRNLTAEAVAGGLIELLSDEGQVRYRRGARAAAPTLTWDVSAQHAEAMYRHVAFGERDESDGRISVIIPTRDEELHIERAVRSARTLGPVFVVDSESTDETVPLAEAAGAVVVTQKWLGHARQKNWALDNLPLTTDWVMFLDADERIPSELAEEIATVTNEGRFAGYYLPRRNIFLGRELKHVWWYPDYQLRLFKRGQARYEDRPVHEHMSCEGPTTELSNALIHENLKGIDAFLERHIRYARDEAIAIADRNEADKGTWVGGGHAGRRRALKTRIWYRMNQRPAVRYIWLYFVRRGFLDGQQGRIYAQLIAAYEAMVDAYGMPGAYPDARLKVPFERPSPQA